MDLKQFIEDNLNLIEDNDFKELYKQANSTIRDYEVCNLTEFLLSCDVDPLPYMDEVPENYLIACVDKNIKNITIPSNIKSIGMYAFYRCKNLRSIIIKNGVETIEDASFEKCTKLKNIVIPNSVKKIGASFSDCIRLESIVIPDSVTDLEVYAFTGCSSLTSVSIGKGIKTIKRNTFSKCINLTEIVIPDSVEVMEGFVFWGCKNLKKITLPKSIKIIKEIFYNCFSLTDIYYEGSEEEWNKINLEECIIPENIKIHFKR